MMSGAAECKTDWRVFVAVELIWYNTLLQYSRRLPKMVETATCKALNVGVNISWLLNWTPRQVTDCHCFHLHGICLTNTKWYCLVTETRVCSTCQRMSVMSSSQPSYFLIINAITAPQHNTRKPCTNHQLQIRPTKQHKYWKEEKTVTKYSDGEQLTFLRHHQHHLGLVHCHDTDPYNSEALTHQPGKHVAVHTQTLTPCT